MKYGRNKIKHIFNNGISCLYLDEEQDDFCDYVEQLQREKEELTELIKNIKQKYNLMALTKSGDEYDLAHEMHEDLIEILSKLKESDK